MEHRYRDEERRGDILDYFHLHVDNFLSREVSMNQLHSLCFLLMHMLEIMSNEEGHGTVQIIMKGLLLVDVSLSQKSFSLLSQAIDLNLRT